MRRSILICVCALTLCLAAPSWSRATTLHFRAILDGLSEAPPNASPGTGVGNFAFDTTALTFRVQFTFQDLIGSLTAAHIHGPTTLPGTGTAGVMTTTPTFPGTPLGVTSGVYDMTFDLTSASSYNAAFIAGNGGTVASARAAFIAAITSGRSYLNLHTTFAPGGEIRGFLAPVPEPATFGLLALGCVGLLALARRGA